MDDIYKDERFAHIPSDPAFKRIPRQERKVKIDKRFQSMFNDKKFKVKFSVDKRGRPVSNSSTENLRRFYACDSSDEEQANEGETPDSKEKEVDNLKTQKNKDKKKVNGFVVEDKKPSSSGSTNEKGNRVKINFSAQSSSEGENVQDPSDDSSEETHGNDSLDTRGISLNEKTRAKLKDLDVDYARGEGVILSDSSSDEESSEGEDEDEISHGWGKLDEDAEKTDESTNRLAVCNMDWDRIKAADLMVLLNSFLPQGGAILSVTVYPSEYGLKRMQEEDAKGPLELCAAEREKEEEENEKEDEESGKKKKEEEEDEFAREKLRKYQLNRLKYYYAVVVCDSISSADALYKECDGLEYESSASRLDLRFIPDDTTFEQEPRDTCSKLPDMTKYEPLLFVTTALQQSKVDLTWDETDPHRLQLNKKINSGNVDTLDEDDLKVYVAISSSDGEESEDGEEEEDKGAAASKYKSLLASIEASEEKERERGKELQVTWGLDLQEKVNKRMKEGKPEELTPFQKYMLKRKEKRKMKREEQLRKKEEYKEANGEVPSESGSEDDVPSDVDLNDPYFKEEFQKEEFANAKKDSKSKLRKKKQRGKVESEDEETKRQKAELELLLMDEDDGKKHFSLKDILVDDSKNKKKKNKRKMVEEASEKPDDFQMNLKDDRFSALFTSHHYNIDPADPHYKKTKGMESLRLEKLNRREIKGEISSKKQKMGAPDVKDKELSLLVKNVKRKVQIYK